MTVPVSLNQLLPTTEERHRGQLRVAYRLAQSHSASLMFVHGLGWHYWDGQRWAEDDVGAARRAVLDVLRLALLESLEGGDRELRSDVGRCESAAGVAGVLDIASALMPFACTVRDLDADPYLLNCANGTLDLQTMNLHDHDPADRITKVCRGAHRPVSTDEAWPAFITSVLARIHR